jgi:hypothetical protein
MPSRALEAWLARVREAEPDRDPIPGFVERDLRKYPAWFFTVGLTLSVRANLGAPR